MKRLLAIALCLALVLSLAACGEGKDESQQKGQLDHGSFCHGFAPAFLILIEAYLSSGEMSNSYGECHDIRIWNNLREGPAVAQYVFLKP